MCMFNGMGMCMFNGMGMCMFNGMGMRMFNGMGMCMFREGVCLGRVYVECVYLMKWECVY